MSFIEAFKTKSVVINSGVNLNLLRPTLELVTEFEETQPRGWRYRNISGKRFIGFIQDETFFLIQKPMQGTRFGAVVQGTLLDSQNLEIKSWVDPRATRKLIFGCFLTIFVAARLVREQFFAGVVPPQDSILPYILLAVIPMTALGAHLYDKNRNEALSFVKNLFNRTD